MARPTKWRRVAFMPQVTCFKPAGVPARLLEGVALSVEELEAIRLKDVEGLQQEECAERMRISRPTFQRVLESARQKVADALINGKAVRIEGGNFALPRQLFRCRRDGHEWRVPFEALASGPRLACPRCDSPSVLPVRPAGSAFGGRGWGQGRGGGRWQGGGR
ncbi:MAG: hypothetical protein AMJ77_04640 [Dehalococcoidia bacterium SM23_28_2]|nr:MAG: hypothetical protein AMJ77_04640 [Dehalococcoidia bacterium SM23_28_2]